MRPCLGILATLALCLGLGSCGGTSTSTSTRRPPVDNAYTYNDNGVTAYFPSDKNDRDNDGDNNNDDGNILDYGHASNATDRRASVALVTRYFSAAAAENGATACSLLIPFVAESVVEDDGRTTALYGNTCAAVMSKLFKLHHALLLAKYETLRIPEVRVEGDKALTILEFTTIPEVRQIAERRVGDSWRILELLDGILE
jgi:hypothetical protein